MISSKKQWGWFYAGLTMVVMLLIMNLFIIGSILQNVHIIAE